TVSGGAIVGALYALRCVGRGNGLPGSYPISELIAEMRPRLTANLRGRALFGRPDHAVRSLLSFPLPSIRRMPLIVRLLDRAFYGRPSGDVAFPLGDGGVYDNEGLNGLRGAGVTHAILSNASPAEGDLSRRGTLHVLAQTVDVMHARLGATTRQLAHEITHGVH